MKKLFDSLLEKVTTGLATALVGAILVVVSSAGGLLIYSGPSALEEVKVQADAAESDVNDLEDRLTNQLKNSVICITESRPFDCETEGGEIGAVSATLNGVETATRLSVVRLRQKASEANERPLAQSLEALDTSLKNHIASYIQVGIPSVSQIELRKALEATNLFGVGPEGNSVSDYQAATRIRLLADLEEQLAELQDRPSLIRRPNTWLVVLSGGGILVGGFALGVGGVRTLKKLRDSDNPSV